MREFASVARKQDLLKRISWNLDVQGKGQLRNNVVPSLPDPSAYPALFIQGLDNKMSHGAVCGGKRALLLAAADLSQNLENRAVFERAAQKLDVDQGPNQGLFSPSRKPAWKMR